MIGCISGHTDAKFEAHITFVEVNCDVAIAHALGARHQFTPVFEGLQVGFFEKVWNPFKPLSCKGILLILEFALHHALFVLPERVASTFADIQHEQLYPYGHHNHALLLVLKVWLAGLNCTHDGVHTAVNHGLVFPGRKFGLTLEELLPRTGIFLQKIVRILARRFQLALRGIAVVCLGTQRDTEQQYAN